MMGHLLIFGELEMHESPYAIARASFFKLSVVRSVCDMETIFLP